MARHRTEVQLARYAKKNGIGREEFLAARTKSVERVDGHDPMSPAVRAAMMADVLMAADEIYGVAEEG